MSTPKPKDYYNLSGKMSLDITHSTSSVGPEGHPNLTFKQLYDRLGGLEGYLIDPKGGKHFFSLKPWEKEAHDKTFFRLAWHYALDESIKPDQPNYPKPNK